MSRARRHLCAVITALLFVTGFVAAAPSAIATTPVPATPTGLPTSIEDMAQYVGQTACDLRTHAGTAALAKLLVATYRDTRYNTTYTCGTDGGQSEHYDGRAIDWMVSARSVSQKAEATAAITWMLATDRAGNRFAMARRLGIQYIIFNNRIWGSWNGQWDAYENCAKQTSVSYDGYCHRNHVHISLSWNGAYARTSFFTKRVFDATDYGPCRTLGLNWAYHYVGYNPVRCRQIPVVTPRRNASALEQTLVRYSGALVYTSESGPIMAAVRQALHISPYSSAALTQTTLNNYQRLHRLTLTHSMDPATWLKLMTLTP